MPHSALGPRLRCADDGHCKSAATRLSNLGLGRRCRKHHRCTFSHLNVRQMSLMNTLSRQQPLQSMLSRAPWRRNI